MTPSERRRQLAIRVDIASMCLASLELIRGESEAIARRTRANGGAEHEADYRRLHALEHQQLVKLALLRVAHEDIESLAVEDRPWTSA